MTEIGLFLLLVRDFQGLYKALLEISSQQHVNYPVLTSKQGEGDFPASVSLHFY